MHPTAPGATMDRALITNNDIGKLPMNLGEYNVTARCHPESFTDDNEVSPLPRSHAAGPQSART